MNWSGALLELGHGPEKSSDLLREIQTKLEAGWEWMKRCPNDDRRNDFFNDKWLPMLVVYEAASEGMTEKQAAQRLVKKERKLPEPSPWIEELREQLIMGGIADVEERPKGRVQD
jgi:hypothetical protein